jgi:photosystem II stability/assembly factor-like uncharacterized protein
VAFPGYCWTELGLADQWVESVADVAGRYYAGTRDGLFAYDPDRSQWARVGFSGKYVTSVTALPGGQRVWVTLAPHGTDTLTAVAYLSDDAGRTWQPSDGGLSAQAAYHGLALSFAFDVSDHDRLYVGLSGQVARSEDAGATWQYVYGGPADRGLGVNALLASASGSPRAWAGGQDAAGRPFVLATSDRGGSWQLVRPSPGLEDAVLSVAVDPQNEARWFAGMAGAIWVTDDAGSSWGPVLVTRRAGWVTGLSFTDVGVFAIADEQAAAAGAPTSALGFYVSTNRGASWDTLPVPTSAAGGRALAVGGAGDLLIGTQSGVWKVQMR